MANFCIMTNNPAAKKKWPDVTEYGEADVAGIFGRVRDAVHLGAVLISHPLAGSLKPNENPYKSVVLSLRRGPHDAKSLQIIEDAIVTLRKMPVKERSYPPQAIEDFQVIDLDLLHSAMGALPAEYHF